MELISQNLNIDFLAKRWIASGLSIILVIGGVVCWFMRGEEKWGIDYVGGHEVVVKLEKSAGSEEIRRQLTRHGIEDPSVQSFEAGTNEFSIRVSAKEVQDDKELEQLRTTLTKALEEAFGTVIIQRTDSVGPTIGAELRQQAVIAILLSLIGMLIYIKIRFEFAYGLGAVVALTHDVVVALGIYLLLGFEINTSTLAAALTIVGYSLNDTIVIFDRVREVIHATGGRRSFPEIFNESLNVTLSRTIITSLLTFFSALALLVLGGGALRDLSLFLVVGLVCGSYSTIFIASPVAIWWLDRSQRRDAAVPA